MLMHKVFYSTNLKNNCARAFKSLHEKKVIIRLSYFAIQENSCTIRKT